jgi:hypothetical protein
MYLKTIASQVIPIYIQWLIFIFDHATIIIYSIMRDFILLRSFQDRVNYYHSYLFIRYCDRFPVLGNSTMAKLAFLRWWNVRKYLSLSYL